MFTLRPSPRTLPHAPTRQTNKDDAAHSFGLNGSFVFLGTHKTTYGKSKAGLILGRSDCQSIYGLIYLYVLTVLLFAKNFGRHTRLAYPTLDPEGWYGSARRSPYQSCIVPFGE